MEKHLNLIKKGKGSYLCLTYFYNNPVIKHYEIYFEKDVGYKLFESIGYEPSTIKHTYKSKFILELFLKQEEENLVEVLLYKDEDEISLYRNDVPQYIY